MLSLRQTSSTVVPSSACFNAKAICCSSYLTSFHIVKIGQKILI
jgi:hypothetical protein